MSKGSIKLDIDPSIIEKNMLINKDDIDINTEFQKYFKPPEDAYPSVMFRPIPGFCVKTWMKSDDTKLFINVCHTDKMPPPDDISEEKLVELLQSDEPSCYRVPMSIGEPRSDESKKGEPATVYDVAINSNFFDKLQKSEVFLSFFIAVIFEGIQDKYQIELTTTKYIILKNKKCFGELQRHRVMQRDIKKVEEKTYRPLIEELSADENVANDNKLQETMLNKINEDKIKKSYDMKYVLRKIMEDDEMKYLLGEFQMDSMVSSNDLNVDVGEDRIIVETNEKIVDVFVPCIINQQDVSATLDQNTRILTLKMAAKEAP